MARTYTREDVLDEAERLKNWGRWGPDDQIGALNFVTPEAIVAAARLVRRGKVFPLGLPLDQKGPQAGLWGGRWNPIHTMLATGTDAVAGKHDQTPGLRYADDALHLPTQCATQWDALSHIFLGEQMWNGYDARLVDCRGAHKCGIEHMVGKMVGRGVLLDVARQSAPRSSPTATRSPWPIWTPPRRRRASRCSAATSASCAPARWKSASRAASGARYAGGPAPGLAFATCAWLAEKEIATICTDTWGIEVRPNETDELSQPLHLATIPAMGVMHGEMFYLKELAADCAADRAFEFFFCAPPLNITGGTGSPINPLAIK